MTEIIPQGVTRFDDLLSTENVEILQGLTVAGLNSDKTKISYRVEVGQFVDWLDQTGAGLSPLALDGYKDYLRSRGYSASKINLALSAIRRMIKQAAKNGLMPRTRAEDLRSVEGVKSEGVRLGSWLTRDEAQELLETPNPRRLKGLRDRAILAVLLGAGLRRSELVNLKIEDIQQREARWVIVDIIGKRGKVRSVPIAPWVKNAIDQWTKRAGIREGVVFRRLLKGGKLTTDPMTAQAVYNLVLYYSGLAGLDAKPHDLRRTSAKLALKGKAALEQISLVLGHESIATTQRYLGIELDLHNSPSDHIDLRI